jgi:hypothetical protein
MLSNAPPYANEPVPAGSYAYDFAGKTSIGMEVPNQSRAPLVTQLGLPHRNRMNATRLVEAMASYVPGSGRMSYWRQSGRPWPGPDPPGLVRTYAPRRWGNHALRRGLTVPASAARRAPGLNK